MNAQARRTSTLRAAGAARMNSIHIKLQVMAVVLAAASSAIGSASAAKVYDQAHQLESEMVGGAVCVLWSALLLVVCDPESLYIINIVIRSRSEVLFILPITGTLQGGRHLLAPRCP